MKDSEIFIIGANGQLAWRCKNSIQERLPWITSSLISPTKKQSMILIGATLK